MKQWGIALIGCGNIADFHIAAIKEIENARLVGISSRSKERAQRIGKQESCFWTTDYQELLKNNDVDLVCLTTSSGTHVAIGLDVIKAGKHLLVEKPIAMTTTDANRLIAMAQKKGVILSSVSQRRFEKVNQETKKIVEEGNLGKLLLIEVTCPFYRSQDYYDSADWRGTIKEDGGALMNQGFHSIDLFLWMGGEVMSVIGSTATQTHQMEAEDLGLGLVTFTSGTKGVVMSSTNIKPGFPPSLYIYGEKGTIKLEGSTITHWTVPEIKKPDIKLNTNIKSGITDPRSISHINHQNQIEDILSAIENRRQPLVTGEDGRNAVQLIESIYSSSMTGKVIEM